MLLVDMYPKTHFWVHVQNIDVTFILHFLRNID